MYSDSMTIAKNLLNSLNDDRHKMSQFPQAFTRIDRQTRDKTTDARQTRDRRTQTRDARQDDRRETDRRRQMQDRRETDARRSETRRETRRETDADARIRNP